MINNVDKSGAKQTIAEATAVLTSYGISIAKTPIMHHPHFAKAISRRKGVTETAPTSGAAEEMGRIAGGSRSQLAKPVTSVQRSEQQP